MNQWVEEELSQLFSEYNDNMEASYGFPKICEILSFLPKKSIILDYGCGAGALSSQLVKDGFFVVGTDISDYSLHKARTLIKSKSATFIQPSELAKHSLSGAFDAATSAFLLCTIESLKLLYNLFFEIGSQIKPGGKYIIIDFNVHAMGVNFESFQAGDKWVKYNNGDKFPVWMKTKYGRTFYFNDFYWKKETLLQCAIETGFFQLNESLSFESLHPDYSSTEQPFVILTFDRIAHEN